MLDCILGARLCDLGRAGVVGGDVIDPVGVDCVDQFDGDGQEAKAASDDHVRLS